MKAFLEKYNGLKYLLYFFIAYMIGFMLLENHHSSRMIITDSWIDSYIPFNEYSRLWQLAPCFFCNLF